MSRTLFATAQETRFLRPNQTTTTVAVDFSAERRSRDSLVQIDPTVCQRPTKIVSMNYFKNPELRGFIRITFVVRICRVKS